jgi:dihydroneopterin aldolase
MPSDKIVIYGIRCRVNIGVEEWERNRKQACAIDLELQCDLRPAGQSDELSDAVDYAALLYQVTEFAETHAFHLMEKLAEEVTALILKNYPITRVTTRIKKLSPPINRKIDFVAVEITRDRNEP